MTKEGMNLALRIGWLTRAGILRMTRQYGWCAGSATRRLDWSSQYLCWKTHCVECDGEILLTHWGWPDGLSSLTSKCCFARYLGSPIMHWCTCDRYLRDYRHLMWRNHEKCLMWMRDWIVTNWIMLKYPDGSDSKPVVTHLAAWLPEIRVMKGNLDMINKEYFEKMSSCANGGACSKRIMILANADLPNPATLSRQVP